MSWFKRTQKEEEKEKSLEELQREYYKRGVVFYNLPHEIVSRVLWGMFWAAVIVAVGFGGAMVYGEYFIEPVVGICVAPSPTIVDAVIIGEDADCVWVAMIYEEEGWGVKCIPKQRGITQIEEWDYGVYGNYLDERCYDGCIENNNHSFCEVVCHVLKRKSYSNSFCDISRHNETFRIYLNMTQEGTSIPAHYLNISSIESCNYRCYGKFEGWTNTT